MRKLLQLIFLAAVALVPARMSAQVCNAVSGLALTSPSSSSIVATWHPGGDEYIWLVSVDGGVWVEVYDTTYVFAGLSSGAWHDVEVRAMCDYGDTSTSVTAGIYTLCDAIGILPYAENFDHLPSEGFPSCWTRGVAVSGEDPPYVYADNMSFPSFATNYLVFTSQTGLIWAVMPAVSEDIDMTDLELTFDVAAMASGYEMYFNSNLLVGVIDSSVYAAGVTVDTLAYYPSIMQSETKYVSFSNYTGDGRNIVFMHTLNTDYFGCLAAIDNLNLHLLSQCERPDSLTLVWADTTELQLSWVSGSGGDFLVEWRAEDSAVWHSEDVYTSTITLDELAPNTLYYIQVRTLCGDDTSVALTGQFRTLCGTVSTFPWVEDFEDDNSFACWNTLSFDNYAGSDWCRNNSSSHSGAYSAYSSYNMTTTGTDWLISPAIEIPSTMTAASLKWHVFGRAYSGIMPHYSVRVSTLSNSDTSTFGAPLFQETRDDGYNDPFTRRTVSLSQYAGETIYIAFVRDAGDDNGLCIDDVSIYEQLSPTVSINGNTTAITNVAATYTARLEDGEATSIAYTWHSARAAAGTATMTVVGTDAVTILYPSVGNDTLRLIATNSHGIDTAFAYIEVMHVDCASIPYSTGFEPSNDVAWSISNGSNGWYIDTAAHHDGAYGLYISANSGASNDYATNATSNSFAYRAFNFATAGQYLLDFDWRCQGEGNWDYIRVYLVPVNDSSLVGGGGYFTAPATWRSLSDNLSASSAWQSYDEVFEVTSPGVYFIVFRWRNDASGGNNPAGAIDNVSLEPVTCPVPVNFTIDSTTTQSAVFHWSPAGSEASWEVTVGNAAPVIVTDTTYTATGLSVATQYAVRIRAICGAGDTSRTLSNSFWTECDIYQTPYYMRFHGPGLDQCWTSFTADGSTQPVTSWLSSLSSATADFARSYAPFNNSPVSDYLISPVIHIPATDTTGLRIVYRMAGYNSNNYANSEAKYEVLVSPTGADGEASFTDTLWVEVMDSTDFQWRRLPLGNYAGQNIRVAFHSVCIRYAQVALYDFAIRDVNVPVYEVSGPSALLTGDTAFYRANYVEGVTAGLTLSWTSSMAAAGQATMLHANTDSMQIVYSAAGIDSITFTATNSYGTYTTTFAVRVMSVNPVTTLPYMTEFETTNNDNANWIIWNGINAWTIGSATHHNGTQALYISNNNGANYQYDNGTASVSYASRAFQLTTTDSLTISFDWNANGESNYDFLRAFFVPDSLFSITANTCPGGVSSYYFATASIPGWIELGGKLNQATDWTLQTNTIAITAPGLYHLVFVWSNDGSMGSNPPAAIDNVTVSLNISITCDTPTLLPGSTTDTTAIVRWTPTADAYEVAIVEGSWVAPANGTPVTDTTYTFSSLSANTLYTVGVRAVCSENLQSEWATITVTTDVHPCYAPSNVIATELTFTSATIAWTPGEESQSLFQIRYSATGDTTLINVSENPYTLSGLYNNTLYSVAVRAVCGDNYSDWSASGTFRTTECEPVSGITVSDITSSGATVSWNDNGSNAYELAYGEQGTSQENFTRQRGTATTYTITGLEASTAYTVYVRSICDEDAYSNWSDSYDFTTHEVGISDIDNSNISLYPNPASSTVTLTGIEGEATVTIIDMNGREIQAIKHSENQAIIIDVSGFAQGAYFVRITGEHFNAIRKLIIR